MRGFVVMIATAEDGLAFWRGAGRELASLGALTWSAITDIRIGEVKPVIGRKAPTIQVVFDGASALTSPIELMVRGEPAPHALERILAAREPRKVRPDR